MLGSGEADLQETGPNRALAGDEGRASRGAGLLGVIIGEQRAFLGDAVDVGRAIAHHATVIGADVPVADIVASPPARPCQSARAARKARPCCTSAPSPIASASVS